uniref:amphoterin-induced protein 3 n=1 Tax=Monopterus albus TaxID=43700 RepID=UPI0009B3CCED|nr:amphoterin-induced protein 3-like [Monopterus albus]
MTSGLYAGLLLMLSCLLHGSEETCPSICLCISDTVSCSSSGLTKLPLSLPSFSVTLDLSHNHLSQLGPGSFNKMSRLENLQISHNQLSTLGHGVFLNASGLRHLDLSSNRLHVVKEHYFQGLWRLEQLLLFNNKITEVEAGTLSSLSSLKNVYFSFNQITHFPFFSIRDYSHPFLTMLDLSSNHMTSLPWENVKTLPGSVQRGLYLHNNSLICDCSMYSVFWHWNLRGYNSVKDFMDEHTCSIYENPQASIRFLRDTRFFHNCTMVKKDVSQPVTVLLSSLLVSEGERVHLDCQTSLRNKDLSFTWLSPSKGFITQASIDDTLISLFPNGTLEIQAAKTLLGCGVTMLLILMYLYLTPCHCNCCKQPRPPVTPAGSYDPNFSTLTSVFLPSTRDQPKIQSNKHVAFMEQMKSEEGAK